MKLPLVAPRGSDRRGIALLLVLVMATLLAAVAVSMVASSRVDRMASSNYLDSSTTRSLIPDAVHNILVLAGGPLNYFDKNTASGGSANLALNIRQSGLAPVPRTGTAANLLSTADRNSLLTPETLAYFSPESRGRIRGFRSSYWQELRDANKQVVGRYTAYIEDQSGLIDINATVPTNGAKRVTSGRDPFRATDIDAADSLAADSGSGAKVPWSASLFTTAEIPYFENAAEIPEYVTGSSQEPDNSKKGRMFTTFSRNPLEVYPPSMTGQLARVEIGKGVANPPIGMKEQFDAMGFKAKSLTVGYGSEALTQTQSEILLDAYQDYVDVDSKPRSAPGKFSMVSNEAVPMISEITIAYRVVSRDEIAGTVTLAKDIQLELHFPYVLPGSTEVSYIADIEADVAFGTKSEKLSRTKVGVFKNSSPRITTSSHDWKTDTYMVSDLPLPLEFIIGKVKATVKVSGDGEVDEVEDDDKHRDSANDPNDRKVRLNSFNANDAVVWHAEVLDPRINARFLGALPDVPGLFQKPWRVNVISGPNADADPKLTPDEVNKYTSDAIAAAPLQFDDIADKGALLSFVRNGEMEMVGELGYLPFNAWQTIKLIPEGYATRPHHPVADYFSTTNTLRLITGEGRVRRGLINPNCVFLTLPGAPVRPTPLSTLFHNMPADYFPENRIAGLQVPAGMNIPLVDALDPSDSTTIASIIEERIPAPPPNYPYLNPADAFYNPKLGVKLRFMPALFGSEIQRESVYRNSLDLMNTRNQFYQILIMVQATRPDDSTDPPTYQGVATEKALVQVWRDAASSTTTNAGAFPLPYPFPYVIHQVTYLND